MKINNIILKIRFSIIAISVLIFCSCRTMRNSGASHSPYIGQTFVTPFGMAFIENLPKSETADDILVTSSSTVWVAARQFDTIDPHCINCLIPERLITPIRVSYVPKGTQFKAIESYRIKYNFIYSLFNNEYDIIIIEDKNGNKAEVNDYFFKYINNIINNNQENYDKIINLAINSIKKNNSYDNSCLKNNGENLILLNKFIKDFRLKNEILIDENSLNNETIKIKFKTITSYLTYLRYQNEWNIKCK